MNVEIILAIHECRKKITFNEHEFSIFVPIRGLIGPYLVVTALVKYYPSILGVLCLGKEKNMSEIGKRPLSRRVQARVMSLLNIPMRSNNCWQS